MASVQVSCTNVESWSLLCMIVERQGSQFFEHRLSQLLFTVLKSFECCRLKKLKK